MPVTLLLTYQVLKQALKAFIRKSKSGPDRVGITVLTLGNHAWVRVCFLFIFTYVLTMDRDYQDLDLDSDVRASFAMPMLQPLLAPRCLYE